MEGWKGEEKTDDMLFVFRGLYSRLGTLIYNEMV